MVGSFLLGVDTVQAAWCATGQIELNTDIPFIGKCIDKNLDESAQQTNVSNAFPRLMASLARILMTVILVGAFMAILVGGLMMASAGFSGKYEEGKSLIIKVIGALALIGISGAILNAVNPNFFKTDSKIETIKYKV
jgi:hypothetical protein